MSETKEKVENTGGGFVIEESAERTLEEQANEIAQNAKANDSGRKISNYEFFSNYNVTRLLDSIDSQGRIKYLSWGKAWMIVKSWDPNATARAVEYDGQPYRLIGIHGDVVVETEITINGQVGRMQLPVYDGSKNAVRIEPYTKLIVKKEGDTFPKSVDGLDSLMWNKSYFRCLVKNLAFNFGLGLTVYSKMETALGLFEVNESGDLLAKDKLQPVKKGFESMVKKEAVNASAPSEANSEAAATVENKSVTDVAEQKPAKASKSGKAKSKAVKESKPEVEEISSVNSLDELGEVEKGTLKWALAHKFEAVKGSIAGKTVAQFVAFPQNDEQVEQANTFLKKVIDMALSQDDKVACQTVLNALTSGEIAYGQSFV